MHNEQATHTNLTSVLQIKSSLQDITVSKSVILPGKNSRIKAHNKVTLTKKLKMVNILLKNKDTSSSMTHTLNFILHLLLSNAMYT